MLIRDNGVIREMTPDEILEIEKEKEELPPPVPSLEETVKKQEQEIADLKAALNALLEKRVQ